MNTDVPLDVFLNKYTSEDNQSFNELWAKERVTANPLSIAAANKQNVPCLPPLLSETTSGLLL